MTVPELKEQALGQEETHLFVFDIVENVSM